MKLTQQQLKQIIKEEISRALKEADVISRRAPLSKEEKEAFYSSEDYHCQGFPYRETGTARACGPTGKDLFGKGARAPNAIYTRWKDLERNQTMYYITHEGKRTVATPKQVKQIRRAMARRMGIKQ